jgi:hypothetical protein
VREEEVGEFTWGGGGWQTVLNLEGERVRTRMGRGMELSLILRSLYALQVGDPRDKIYGVLGIVDDGDELGLRTDYGISAEYLCSNVATDIMLKDKSLGLSAMAGIGWSTKAPRLLPSWAPDFSNSGGNNWDTRTWVASGKSKF